MKTLRERLAYRWFHHDTAEDLQRREMRRQAARILAERLMNLELAFPVERVLLYGSVARGDDGPESDIDLGVVIDCQEHEFPNSIKDKTERALWDCARTTGRELFGESPVCPFQLMIFSRSIYENWGDFSAVINRIRADGILLTGTR